MSSEEQPSTETGDEARVEWRKRLYVKQSTLIKLSSMAKKELRSDEAMAAWILERFFDDQKRTV